jgi:hypothetical protein
MRGLGDRGCLGGPLDAQRRGDGLVDGLAREAEVEPLAGENGTVAIAVACQSRAAATGSGASACAGAVVVRASGPVASSAVTAPRIRRLAGVARDEGIIDLLL